MGKEGGRRLARWAVASIVALVRALPHRWAVALGSLLGRALWLVSWRKVDLCEARCVMALGVGVTRAREIVRGSFVNVGRSAAEFARLDLIAPDALRELVRIEGADVLGRAMNRGKGVLLMAAHMGNWELSGARMVLEGHPIVPIYTPQRDTGGVEAFIQRQRAAAGMEMIKSEGAALRGAFKALRAGKILCVLQDLDARASGVRVSFFGMPASAHVGIVEMHRRLGSPVVPLLCRRAADGIHHEILMREILSDRVDDDGTPWGVDRERSLMMCNDVLEGWIRACPDQWLWLLDRWASTMPKP